MDEGQCVLEVRVVPNAKREGPVTAYGKGVKIWLRAPAVEGKANRALLKFLAKWLGVPGSTLEILSGETARNKRIAIHGMDATRLAEKLAAIEGA